MNVRTISLSIKNAMSEGTIIHYDAEETLSHFTR